MRPNARRRIEQPATYALLYGNAHKVLIQVVPDDRWPGMFRLAWPDGRRSDMTNLSRAKDAAVALLEFGPPARNRRCFNWGRAA
jgi:hypothetical protein